MSDKTKNGLAQVPPIRKESYHWYHSPADPAAKGPLRGRALSSLWPLEPFSYELYGHLHASQMVWLKSNIKYHAGDFFWSCVRDLFAPPRGVRDPQTMTSRFI